MANVPLSRPQQAIPIWRDTKYIAILLQVAFVVLVVIAGGLLLRNMLGSLEEANISPSFSFLDEEAGIPIGLTAIDYTPSDSYARAFFVGLLNTVLVSVFGIILATLLGLVVGISRLSSNWLLRKTAEVFIELMRNIPLLVLLLFLFAVNQTFPKIKESWNFFGLAYLSNRGISIAWFRPSESFNSWLIWLAIALLVGGGVFFWRRMQLKQQDRPGAVLPWALLATFIVAVLGVFATQMMTGSPPLYLDVPVLDKFKFKGGTELPASFFVMLVGLVIYTSAFIGEIVRAGIMSVSKGQREAAKALGLSEGQALRLIILPQALRVMIPPMTSEYLNLTKNSSLAIAVGYPDLVAVGNTIANQTGQAITMIMVVMGCYLSLSLFTSLLMNIYNRQIQLVER